MRLHVINWAKLDVAEGLSAKAFCRKYMKNGAKWAKVKVKEKGR
jgi:hypothetical protein